MLGLAVSGLTALGLLALLLWEWRPRSDVQRRAPWRLAAAARRSDGREIPPSIWMLTALAAILAIKFLFVDPSTTWLRCASTAERVCGAQATVDVPFVGGHRLRGYSVSPERTGPGDVLKVDLYWQADAGVPAALQSFVHVRNSRKDWPMNPRTENELWAQDEHVTPGGFLSTGYVPGKLYHDAFRIRLPEDMPPGEYFLEVGWFDPVTGEQLDPQADAVQSPLGILWRSVLLPNVQVQ
jgi:hypothetical protein